MMRHLAVAAGFVALAVVWTLPLAFHLSTHLPGAGIGDNATFLWNFWWMRTALASHTGFFHMAPIFAPAGADLTLHTHTALPAWIGATLLAPFPSIVALNITTLAALALNGFCTYVLIWRLTRNARAAVIGGIVFAWSPYIAAHLNGHFNLTSAWTLPLFALAALEAIGHHSTRWSVLAGLVLATTAYVDYYYVIFELALLTCLAVISILELSIERRAGSTPPWLATARTLTYVLLAIDLCVIVIIVASGGFDARIGAIRISANGLFNPLQGLWALLAIAATLYLRPQVTMRPRPGARRAITAGIVIAMTFALAVSPLIVRAIEVVRNGDYASQQYYWRSAPVGVDAASLVLGNPFHGLWGAPVRRLYSTLHIDPIESAAWPGLVPLVLAAHAIRRRRGDPTVRLWLGIGAVFLVWSFGSHLFVLGRNTAMILPAALLRWVPLVANARMPGRAIVMTYLALAVVAAYGVTEIDATRRWRVATAAVGLLLLDFLAAPVATTPVECPPIYETLRDRPEHGAVVELPLGMGDGFGALTPVDNGLMLACQTIHHRPLAGGSVSRLSPRVVDAYRRDPLLAAWLRMSGAAGEFQHAVPPDRTLATERMNDDGFAFVLLNRTAASPELRAYVERVLPLTLVASDGRRSLYVFDQIVR